MESGDGNHPCKPPELIDGPRLSEYEQNTQQFPRRGLTTVPQPRVLPQSV